MEIHITSWPNLVYGMYGYFAVTVFPVKSILSDVEGRTGEYVLIAIWVAGLFVPLHVVAKKYE